MGRNGSGASPGHSRPYFGKLSHEGTLLWIAQIADVDNWSITHLDVDEDGSVMISSTPLASFIVVLYFSI